MTSTEIQSLRTEVNALKGVVLQMLELVKELDSDSAHTEYCMSSNCFRCDIAWGNYGLDR